MTWSDGLRWLIPLAFVVLAEALRRRRDAESRQQLVRVRSGRSSRR